MDYYNDIMETSATASSMNENDGIIINCPNCKRMVSIQNWNTIYKCYCSTNVMFTFFSDKEDNLQNKIFNETFKLVEE